MIINPNRNPQSRSSFPQGISQPHLSESGALPGDHVVELVYEEHELPRRALAQLVPLEPHGAQGALDAQRLVREGGHQAAQQVAPHHRTLGLQPCDEADQVLRGIPGALRERKRHNTTTFLGTT